MFEQSVTPRSLDAFRGVLGETLYRTLEVSVARLREVLGGRRVWNVNSTPSGGGVAEMLSTLLAYEIGAGIDAHWLVICGSDDFFEVTKRIHNHLHESAGDTTELGERERELYDLELEAEGHDIESRVEPGDLVILHDPQTAGLIPVLREHGVRVVWRCHVGIDEPGELARGAWAFLASDVAAAHRCVFSRPSYVWDCIDPQRVAIVPPCIDVISPKNQPMRSETVSAILRATGIVDTNGAARGEPDFRRVDGTTDVVVRRARILEEQRIPADAPLVVQVSRWDQLKDPGGVLRAFTAGVLPRSHGAHLALVGPEVDGVEDDPESSATYGSVRRAWERLPESARRKTHLIQLPMVDDDENSAIVNAVQRRADVVVQKSLAEGFGLTVAEAMWKDRPVVASRVGGIQDQIVDGVSGVLLDDPCDVSSFGEAVGGLLADHHRARSMGIAARQQVCDRYLPSHHFEHEAGLCEAVLG